MLFLLWLAICNKFDILCLFFFGFCYPKWLISLICNCRLPRWFVFGGDISGEISLFYAWGLLWVWLALFILFPIEMIFLFCLSLSINLYASYFSVSLLWTLKTLALESKLGLRSVRLLGYTTLRWSFFLTGDCLTK